MANWKPGRWYRIVRPDGTLWMETSNREEAMSESLAPGYTLQRLWSNIEEEWRDE